MNLDHLNLAPSCHLKKYGKCNCKIVVLKHCNCNHQYSEFVINWINYKCNFKRNDTSQKIKVKFQKHSQIKYQTEMIHICSDSALKVFIVTNILNVQTLFYLPITVAFTTSDPGTFRGGYLTCPYLVIVLPFRSASRGILYSLGVPSGYQINIQILYCTIHISLR